MRMRWNDYHPRRDLHWQEYECQSYPCMRMNAMRGYGRWWTYAADINGLVYNLELAAATGIAPGEPDLRLSFLRGKTVYVELKMKWGEISDEQEKRHDALRRLGFTVYVIWCDTPWDCWKQLEAIISRHMRVPLLPFLW